MASDENKPPEHDGQITVGINGVSKRELANFVAKYVQTAQKRERWIVEQAQRMIAHEQMKLNGMTKLLGCIVERHGPQVFDFADIEAMDHGRMFVKDVAENGVRTWTADIRDDSSKPVEVYVGPDTIPEEALDKEAMERDGVTEVKVPREEMH